MAQTFAFAFKQNCVTVTVRMPFGSLKKSQGGIKSKVFPVKITTMEADMEFKIEVGLELL